jgi:aryl-alcohol dehydrogenase-like predicted oxidoreductase
VTSIYGDGEAFLGQWFKKTGQRDRIFLATKFGYLKRAGSIHEVDSSAKYCKEACEASLRALGTDYIDLCERSAPCLIATDSQTTPTTSTPKHPSRRPWVLWSSFKREYLICTTGHF